MFSGVHWIHLWDTRQTFKLTKNLLYISMSCLRDATISTGTGKCPTHHSCKPQSKFELKGILVSFLLFLIFLQLLTNKRRQLVNGVRRKMESDTKLRIIPIEPNNSLTTDDLDPENNKTFFLFPQQSWRDVVSVFYSQSQLGLMG